jgi:hypothetical protein
VRRVRDEASTSEERRPLGRGRKVSGKVYDPLPEDAQPPLGVDDVSIEPMDPSGVELLAGELIQLLEWAGRNKVWRDG